MLSKTKRNLFAVLFILLFFSCGILFAKKDTFLFHRLTESLWEEQLSEDTLSMHYTVAHPEHYHLAAYRPVLPAYSRSSYDKAQKRIADCVTKLRRIQTSSLNGKDAWDCKLLLSYLEAEKSESSYPYYEEPLSPSSGSQSQLPILLAEYSFRTKRDVTDYLALLDQTDDYLEGLTVYEREKSAEGLFMSDTSADKVIEQCSDMIDEAALEERTHFLVLTFEERLAALLQKGVITEEEQALYLSENDRLLSTVLLPAYEKLADELFLLKGSGRNECGLCHFPDGKDYYALLVSKESGSSKTIAELKAMLLKRFSLDYTEFAALASKAGLSPATVIPSDSSMEEPKLILTHLEQEMKEDFPDFPASDVLPSCTVKEVSKGLEAYTSPAFYLTPPLDDISNNVIYVNKRSTPAGLSLYTTLAHEGYPGHLYQSVYYQLYSRSHHLNPVRSLLHYGGYLEGWALYVETLSYDYACRLLKDSPDREQLSLLYQLERSDRDMQLCLYSLLDIAIHYDGASYEQVHHVLDTFGISNPALTKQIYEYIVENPANYLKYYVGYLEILNLKQDAVSLWGDSYSDKAFHTFFLEAGPCGFDALSELLQETKPSR